MPRLHAPFESDFAAGKVDGSTTASRLGCDVLFAASRESVLIVDADSGFVMDANPSAATLLQTRHAELMGATLKAVLGQCSLGIVNAGFALAQIRGGTHELTLPAVHGRSSLSVRISVFRSGEKSFYLMRLGSNDASVINPVSSGSTMFQLIDNAPVGFLVTDANLRIDYANRAFNAMVDGGSRPNLLRTSLVQWLDLSVAELTGLQVQLYRRQAVTRLTSNLRCAAKGAVHVEVHAIAVPDDQEPCWGFSVNLLCLLN